MAFINTCNPMTFQYNVGIGTDTNLVQTLTLCGTNTRIESRGGGNTSAGAYYTVYNGASLVGQSSQFVDNAGNWILYTGTTSESERLRVTAAGNVGIGTTSPSDNLHIAASEVGNVGIAIQNTNASYSSQVRFLNSAGGECSAITYVQSSNFLAINVNGGNRLNITNAGNVGIGTETPNKLLDVRGDSYFYSSNTGYSEGINVFAVVGSSSGAGINFHCAATGTTGGSTTLKGFLRVNSSGTCLLLGVFPGSDLYAMTVNVADGNVRFAGGSLTTAGNVGIGTTSPASILHASGSGDVILRAQSSGNSTTANFFLTAVGGVAKRYYAGINVSSTNGAFEIYDDTCASSRLLVSSIGNVGIGTTTPCSRLDARESANKTTLGNSRVISLWHNGNSVGTRAEVGFGYSTGTYQPAVIGSIVIADGGGGAQKDAIYFATRDVTTDTQPTERMRITTAGNVGIGTCNPSYLLHVNGTFYAAGSSIKYKHSICDYDTDSCIFMCLKPVTYQYKDEWQHLGREMKSQSQIGLIAEDVAQVMPELAILVNEEEEKVVRNVDYEKLSVVLLKEVQKLRREMDDLKHKEQ